MQVHLALEIEEKMPWIRRRLKKTSYRVQKYSNIPHYFIWYQKFINSIFGNSFKELEKTVNDLQSEDKLTSLLQGLEVIIAFHICNLMMPNFHNVTNKI